MRKEEIRRLFDLPRYQQTSHPRADMVNTKRGNTWWSLSTREFIEMCDAFAKGLIAMGVKKGDKIGVVSKNNRTEWNIVDIGVQECGAILVPLYPNISIDDYIYILNESEMIYCFCGDREMYEKVMGIKGKVPTLQKVFVMDDEPGLPSWHEVINAGKGIDTTVLEKRMQEITENDLATIIYTSGTTGLPKGVMLTHWNIVSNVFGCEDRVPPFIDHRSKALSFLPLCHIFERMIFYLYVYLGVGIYYARSMDTIVEDIREVRPDIMTVVPRLLEKVYERIMEKGAELRGFKRTLFNWSVGLASKWDPDKRSVIYNMKLWFARKLVFKKWKEALGGNLKVMVSGGAALAPHLARIFNGAGIPCLEGYGLTETSPVVAVNSLEKGGMRIGTVGRPIKNVSVKIAEDGEILVKGPNVMVGYYKKEQETRAVFTEDGYFATGDIGVLEDGFLKITDRKKELFKTSGGKYIAPQVIENKLKVSPFIEMACVIGEGRKFPAALIVPNYEYLKKWAEKEGISAQDIPSLLSHPAVIKKYEEEMHKVNQTLGKWEQIKKFRLLPEPFMLEKEELTPTLKLKRRNIMLHYASIIEEIYREE